MKHSLHYKVFRMYLIPVAVAVILFMILGILQTRRFARIMRDMNEDQNEVILDTMSTSMREQAMENFQKYVVSEATVLNGEFRTIRHSLEVLAAQVEAALQAPSWGAGQRVSPPSMEDAGKMTAQLMYSDDADRTSEALQEQIGRIGCLAPMMKELVVGSNSLMDCVVSLKGGASIMMDNVPEAKFDKDGKLISFPARTRPWYAGAVVHEGTYFAPVNQDYFFDSLQIMVGVPVFLDGKLAAVCGGSLDLDMLGDIVAHSHLGEYTKSCLINSNGNLVYSSYSSGELGLAENHLKSLKESSNVELVSLLNEALSGDVGFSMISINGVDTYVAYAPVETVGWTQLLTISREDLNRTAYLLLEQTNSVMEESSVDVGNSARHNIILTISIGGVLLLLAVFVSMYFSTGLVRPIMGMTNRVQAMKGEDMDFRVDDSMRTGDEIELLADAFERMSVKMKGYVGEIVQITAEKQRLDTELSVAADIQRNMLPNHFPAFPGRSEFDLYATMEPAKEVGGDFYDFFLVDEDHLAVIMADVSGKGVPAALFMVVSKTMIKNAALSGIYDGPASILSKVNDLLCEGNEDDMFVTVWLGILTISTGEMVSACAGHEYPVFYRKGKGFILEKDSHGIPMGGMTGIYYKECTWKLDPGDMLFLYTDGLPEAINSEEEQFGTDRMLEALEKGIDLSAQNGEAGYDRASLKEFLRQVRRQVDDFVGDTPQFDDMTMLCLKYR